MVLSHNYQKWIIFHRKGNIENTYVLKRLFLNKLKYDKVRRIHLFLLLLNIFYCKTSQLISDRCNMFMSINIRKNQTKGFV